MCKIKENCSGGAIYFFGLIGSAIYFISESTTFWMGAFGILKAIVWPAILTYTLFSFFGV